MSGETVIAPSVPQAPAPVPAQQPAAPQQEPQTVQVPNQQQVPPGLPQPGTNPMLSRVSQEPPKPEPPVPAPQPQAPEPPKPQPHTNALVQELAGSLANDPQAKLSIGYVEAICSKAEVDLQRAFGKAAEHSDVRFVDTEYLKEKLGADADAVLQQVTGLFEYSAAKYEQSMQTLYTAVGGQAVLEQAIQAFNEAASDDERAEIALMLDSGNTSLMTRAAQRIVDSARAAGKVYAPGNHINGQPSATRGLSKAEYQEKLRDPRLTEEQYVELRKQRELGRRQGI